MRALRWVLFESGDGCEGRNEGGENKYSGTVSPSSPLESPNMHELHIIRWSSCSASPNKDGVGSILLQDTGEEGTLPSLRGVGATIVTTCPSERRLLRLPVER